MILVDAHDARRRVKAAMAYAGFEHKDVVKKAGVSDSTLKRIVSTKHPRGASIEQLWAIADACKVPRDFMEYGFPDGEESVVERLAVLERGLDHLRELLVTLTPADAMEAAVRAIADEASNSQSAANAT